MHSTTTCWLDVAPFGDAGLTLNIVSSDGGFQPAVLSSADELLCCNFPFHEWSPGRDHLAQQWPGMTPMSRWLTDQHARQQRGSTPPSR